MRKDEPGKDIKASFVELYDQHFDAVNRYLRYRMDNPWDADDLTAAIFLKALENMSRYRGDAPVAVWLFRITHNAYVDFLRRRKKDVPVNDETIRPEMTHPGPEEELLRSEEVRQLKDMLKHLSPEQRDVISLRYAGELKFAQIAQVLEKSESAVRMIHYRALKALRAVYLNEKGVEGIARG